MRTMARSWVTGEDSRMQTYLEMERLMFQLEAEGDCTDSVCNLMDLLWYSMSDEEHESLNSRGLITGDY